MSRRQIIGRGPEFRGELIQCFDCGKTYTYGEREILLGISKSHCPTCNRTNESIIPASGASPYDLNESEAEDGD